MSNPKPGHIAQWIIDDFIEEKFRPLKIIIEEIVNSRIPEFSVEQCAEIAESCINEVNNVLSIIETENTKQGVEPIFEIFLDGEEVYYRSIKSDAKDLLEKLKLLDWQDFEHFCACLLKSMGSESSTEGSPDDQGVDFFARKLPVGYIKDRPETSNINLLVFGQAKRYSSNLIGEKEIRSFVGGAIKKSFDYIRKNLYEVGTGIFSPIIYAFWTTSDFHPRAKKFCNEVGLWSLNGLALSQLAIRVGFTTDNLDNKIEEYKKSPLLVNTKFPTEI